MGGPWAKQERTGERVTANVLRARIANQRSQAVDQAKRIGVIAALALARIHAP